MPRGPRGEKRLADTIANAVLVAKIATGEVEDTRAEPKDPAAIALGRKGGQKGGKARADRMTAGQRSEAAKHAAKSRWQKSGRK
jgi:hypothetical protein